MTCYAIEARALYASLAPSASTLMDKCVNGDEQISSIDDKDEYWNGTVSTLEEEGIYRKAPLSNENLDLSPA